MRALRILGVLLVLVGVLWFGQGIGLIGGSFMSGEAVWAVIGLIAVALGAAFIRGSNRARRDED